MAMEEVKRTEELLREARAAEDKEDLLEIMDEMADITRLAAVAASPEKDLAEAVCAFAEWQSPCYGDRDPHTRRVVSEQLWSEVSDRVYAINGSRPTAPTFGAAKPDL
jgi:hypothetical protein